MKKEKEKYIYKESLKWECEEGAWMPSASFWHTSEIEYNACKKKKMIKTGGAVVEDVNE